MAITDWPELERPREKLLHLGAASLSDAELLAIFLRTGVSGKSAVDLARELLVRRGSLGAVLAVKRSELGDLPGLGEAKFSQLQAVLEMARRALAETLRAGDALGAPGAVRDYLRLTLANREQEVFLAVLLDAQNRVLACDELFRGTLTQTSVYTHVLHYETCPRLARPRQLKCSHQAGRAGLATRLHRQFLARHQVSPYW